MRTAYLSISASTLALASMISGCMATAEPLDDNEDAIGEGAAALVLLGAPLRQHRHERQLRIAERVVRHAVDIQRLDHRLAGRLWPDPDP